MRYKLLGKSGIRVSELCLGTMTFGEEWGAMGADKSTSEKVYRIYREAGGNFIDTANKYTAGTSESFLGEFMDGEREEIVLASKYTGTMDESNPNSGGNARKAMARCVEDSLKRLRTDYLDLLWVHAWDFTVAPNELMRALDDLVRAGKVLTVGISDTPAWIVAQCNTLAELRGWSSFVGLQIEYSLAERTVERELVPMAEAFDLAITPWSPLAGGLLTGKYRKNKSPKEGRQREVSNAQLEIAEALVEVAESVGATPAQTALAWLRQRPIKVPVIPIIGARRPEQLEDSLKATDLTLPANAIDKLDQCSAVRLGFPHEFLRMAQPQQFIYGPFLPRIDDPHGRLPKPG